MKKELDELRRNYEKKLEESTSNSKCSKCDNAFANVGDVTKPQDKQYSVSQTIKCDICEKVFDVKWKMTAHLKTCKKSQCEVFGKTIKYEELKQKYMLKVHEDFKMYCHFFNNEKSCPHDQDCVFLHEVSKICKYGTTCERNYCMFKHMKERESERNDDDIDEKKDKESVNMNGDKNERYDNIEVVNVEIVIVDIVNADGIIVENDDKLSKVDDKCPKVLDKLLNVDDKFPKVDDEFPKVEYKLPNVKDKPKVNPIPDKIAGSGIFHCKTCNFLAKDKVDLFNHKVSDHNW